MKKGLKMMCAGLLAASVLAGSAVHAEGNPYAEMEPAELMKAYNEVNWYTEYLREKYIVSDICFELPGEYMHVVMGPNDYCYYTWTSADGTILDEELTMDHVSCGGPVDADGRQFNKITIYDDQLWEYQRNAQLSYMPNDIYNENAHIENIQDVDGATSFAFVYPIDDAGKAYLEAIGMSDEEIDAVQTIEEDILTEKGSLRTVSCKKYAVSADKKVLYDTTRFEYPDTVDNHEREAEMKASVYSGDELHTVTLTVAPGTKKEEVYTVTANQDTVIDAWVGSTDGTYDIYTDDACTIPYEGLVDETYIPLSEDAALYMK